MDRKKFSALKRKISLLLALSIALGGPCLNPSTARPEEPSLKISEAQKPASQTPEVMDGGPDHYRQMGDQLRKKKKYDEAIHQYQNVLTLQPDDSHSLFWIATIYRWTRRPKEAEIIFGKILKSHPDHVDAKIGLAYLYLSQKRFDHTMELIRDVLEDHAESFDAQIIYARILEREGMHKQAVIIYESLAKSHPDNRSLQRRYKQLLERTRPLLRTNYRFSETRVLEGRGDPVGVSRMEYLNTGYGLEGSTLLPRDWKLYAESTHRMEKLTLLELDDEIRDRIIYDFDTVTRLAGASYRPDRPWTFQGDAGLAQYKSQDVGSIDKEDIRIYNLQLQYEEQSHQLGLKVQRRPFLGRSAGGGFDFNLFTVNRISMQLSEELDRQTSLTIRGNSSHYSDGNNSLDLSIAVKYKRKNQIWRLSINKSPLQERFLVGDPDDLSLRFIEVYGTSLDFTNQLTELWAITILGRFRIYEDDNYQRHMIGRLEYRIPFAFEMVAGIEEESDYFSRDSSLYNNLTIFSRTVVFLKVQYFKGTHVDTKIKLFAAVTSDEGDQRFSERGMEANLEYASLPFIKVGASGLLSINTLSDRRGKLYAYLQYFF